MNVSQLARYSLALATLASLSTGCLAAADERPADPDPNALAGQYTLQRDGRPFQVVLGADGTFATDAMPALCQACVGGGRIGGRYVLQGSRITFAAEARRQDSEYPFLGSYTYRFEREQLTLQDPQVSTALTRVGPLSVAAEVTARLRLVNTGGGLMGEKVPKGEACVPNAATYELDLTSRTLKSVRCEVGAPQTRAQTLSDTDLAAVGHAMAAMRLSTRTACGADKPTLTVELNLGAVVRKYADDFYACQSGPLPYVSGIDTLASELDRIAHKP